MPTNNNFILQFVKPDTCTSVRSKDTIRQGVKKGRGSKPLHWDAGKKMLRKNSLKVEGRERLLAQVKVKQTKENLSWTYVSYCMENLVGFSSFFLYKIQFQVSLGLATTPIVRATAIYLSIYLSIYLYIYRLSIVYLMAGLPTLYFCYKSKPLFST